MDNIFEQHASSHIVFKLENFEGPIALLVELCKQSGLDIHTVRISMVTDQYLQYMREIGEAGLDLDLATDFLLMAATLLELKARAAVPRDEEEIEDEEYINAEDEIRLRMIEYQMFKEKAEEIKTKETLNRFYREPVFTEHDARVSIVGFNLDKLMQAYAKVLYKFSKVEDLPAVKTIERDEFSVSQQLDYLVKRISKEKKICFFDLFQEDYTRSEIITTFLAMLQLVSKQFASIDQEDRFGNITISLNATCDPEMFDYSVLAMEENNVE